jgi:hypothetical protein
MATFEEYTRHVDWSLTVGRRRTRQTARQAASTMRELEGAQALLEAEEAVDDPLRMARCLAGRRSGGRQLVHVPEPALTGGGLGCAGRGEGVWVDPGQGKCRNANRTFPPSRRSTCSIEWNASSTGTRNRRTDDQAAGGWAADVIDFLIQRRQRAASR